MEILQVNPQMISLVKNFNPRSNVGATLTRDFKLSIKKHGVLQPLRVTRHKRFKNKFWLVDGERRLKAALDTGKKTVPCIVVEPKNDTEALLLTMTLSTTGEKLDPMDEAKAFNRILSDTKITKKDLAKELGVHITTIENRIALFNAPPEVKAAVESGKITKTAAAKISKPSKAGSKKEVKKEVKKAIKQRKEKGLSIPEINDVIEAKVAAAVKLTGEEAVWMRGIIHGLTIAANMPNVIASPPYKKAAPKMVFCDFEGGKKIPVQKCLDTCAGKAIYHDCRKCGYYRRYIIKVIKKEPK